MVDAGGHGTTGGGTPPGFFGVRRDGDADRVVHARRLVGPAEGLVPLDRLADLAAQLLGAGSAQVSLIADAQVVMGGAGVARATGEPSPAAESLCTVTTRTAGPVPIADTATDPRVRDLPPVTSGAVGAYLGVPLVSAGHVVGALCVFDREPRSWSEADVRLLEQLAAPVVAELELAALSADYEDDRRLWQVAVDAAGVGAFDWDLRTGALRWDDRLLELFGVERSAFGGTIEAFDDLVHPDDRDRVGRALDEAIAQVGTYEAEYRVVRPDGGLRWVAARGHAIAEPGTAGPAVRVLGAAHDTTVVREGEARVARALEAMPTALLQLDHDWRFTYANPEARRLLAPAGSDLVGHVLWELFPATVGSEFEQHYRLAVSTDQPVTFEAHYPAPLDAWFEIRCWPTPDGLSLYFLDITERRHAQEQVARAAERAALLAEVTGALTDTLDGEEAVTRLTQLLVPALADWCVVTLVDGPRSTDPLDRGWRHRLRDVGWWHHDETARATLARYVAARVPALGERSLVAQVLRDGERVVLDHDAAERVAEALDHEGARELVRALAPGSAVAVPLPGRGRLAGVVTLFRDAARPPFGADELEVLGDVAGRAGLALDAAQQYAGQRDLAAGLQRSMLTAPPEPDHLQVAVRYEPAAETAQVGGDWYDVFLTPDGALTLVIGDVMGHDTSAAAAMGQVRTLLRGIAVTTGDGPAQVLGRVDEAMLVLGLDTLATAVVARLEQTPEERAAGTTRLRWSNAGHPPPVVLVPHEDGGTDVRLLEAEEPCPMLGLETGQQRHESVVVLPRGATVLLFTDGLVERRDTTIDEGLRHLLQVLRDAAAQDCVLDDLADRVLHAMLPGRTGDDVALAAVRLHPEDVPRPAEAGPEHVPAVFAAPGEPGAGAGAHPRATLSDTVDTAG